jgi:phosphate starvation-inducible membrane PsiE
LEMDTYDDFFIFFIFFSIETSISKGFSMDFHGFQIAMFDF